MQLAKENPGWSDEQFYQRFSGIKAVRAVRAGLLLLLRRLSAILETFSSSGPLDFVTSGSASCAVLAVRFSNNSAQHVHLTQVDGYPQS